MGAGCKEELRGKRPFIESTRHNLSCGCGIWAFKTRLQALEMMVAMPFDAEGLCYGQVQLWGRVIEHTEGYRAEWAEPVWGSLRPLVGSVKEG